MHTDGAFNTTSGWGYGSGSFWNTTSPTSTTISLGSIADMNGSGNKFLALCFASTAGVLKVGSYNGSNSDLQVTTGFQPSFVMVKNADLARPWATFDNVRSGIVYINETSAMVDTASNYISYNSTGFQLVGGTGTYINEAGYEWIYLAIA